MRVDTTNKKFLDTLDPMANSFMSIKHKFRIDIIGLTLVRYPFLVIPLSFSSNNSVKAGSCPITRSSKTRSHFSKHR
jgi:hypothetical protein